MATLIYFQNRPLPNGGPGSLEAAKKIAPAGQVRFANAKFFREGEFEAIKFVKKPRVGKVPVLFDSVLVMPEVAKTAEIRETYKSLGKEVEVLEASNGSGDQPPAPPAAVTAKDLGWSMKMAPAKYLKKYPQGAKADKAREVIAKLEG